jgi:hypothetical protein
MMMSECVRVRICLEEVCLFSPRSLSLPLPPLSLSHREHALEVHGLVGPLPGVRGLQRALAQQGVGSACPPSASASAQGIRGVGGGAVRGSGERERMVSDMVVKSGGLGVDRG